MQVFIAAFYALVVLASGLMRYLGQSGGEKGLWFGIVFGSLAAVAAICFAYRKRTVGTVAIWLCMLFVGGWFVYEALIKKGISEAEPRMLVVIGITGAVAMYYLFAARGNSVATTPADAS